jgi:2-oxo-4-hydroxy-4-carboxy--5-ureidoimidazoline (OHCU) decarboxylase
LNNNMYLYRGIKIEPGNDILYNAAIVRRNNQELKAFKNKTVDIYFTRDNIYLRLMENQRVKDVRSLYSILTSVAETYSPIQDMRAISMFPAYSGELASVNAVYNDVVKEKQSVSTKPVKKRQGILQFFQF